MPRNSKSGWQKKSIMSDIKINPDWPENRFSEYFHAAKSQLGELWTLSDDATVANCGNLQLLWSPIFWTWILEADCVEIGRFILPFQGVAHSRFRRLCSAYYRSA